MEFNKNVLDGVKVLELSTFVAAPGCAKVMADWGADVIKLEPISGDIWRLLGPTLGMPASTEENPCFDVDNGNKRGLSLDLKSAEGQEILHKLLSEADVMITNYRPEALKKLNLTYEELSKKYEELVYGQILGFGEKGPHKDRPGYDITAYLARAGIMSQLGEPDAPPLNIISSFGDHQAAMNLAAGICGALCKRHRTGIGEKITVSLYHTAIYALSTMLAGAQYNRIVYPISRKLPLNPIVNTYQCKDGRWLVLVCPDFENQWGVICNKVFNRKDLATSERYKGRANLFKHRAEIVEIMDGIFMEKDIKEWSELLEAGDLPFEKLQNWNEVIEDEQAWANDYLHKISYANGKEAVLATSPVQFKGMGLPDFNMAPKLGEHTEEILGEIGFSNDEIQKMKDGKVIRTC